MSVLVRSPSATRVYFLEVLRHAIGSSRGFPLVTAWHYADGFAYQPASQCHGHPIVRAFNVLRQPIVIALGGTGIFNLLSIAYALPPQLRDRLTQGRRALPWKPWVFGEADFHRFYRVLMPCIITRMRSSAPYGTPSQHILRSPTAHPKRMNP